MTDLRGHTVPFPYEHPYVQQVNLMETIFRGLDAGSRLLMLESPTGTGKSLSLACAALVWLREQERRDLTITDGNKKEGIKKTITGIDWLDSWVSPEERDQQAQAELTTQEAQAARNELHEHLSRLRQGFDVEEDDRRRVLRKNILRKEIAAAKMNMSMRKRKRLRKSQASTAPSDGLMLEDYHSDTEKAKLDDPFSEQSTGSPSAAPSLTAARLLDGARLDGSQWKTSETTSTIGRVTPGSGVRKIVYAARTHSQLSQFIGEIRRTVYGKDVRVVALGSRTALCGNKNINRKSETYLNEACLDLKDKGGCSLLSSKDAVETLALHSLAEPTDIEEAASLGSHMETCAYYASRKALAAAEVVVLPYSMLLSQNTRQAIGLSLEQALVIVDEAHNLPEALRGLHACRLSLPVVEAAAEHLQAYTTKYLDRLAGRNLHYLGQIKKVLVVFAKHLKTANPKLDGRLVTPGELLTELKLDNINLFKILRYLNTSRLAQKLLGFMQRDKKDASAADEDEDEALSKHVSALSIVQTFLEKLTHSGKEGKMVTDRPEQGRVKHATLRYVLLHPAAFFDNVRQEARALALVGGTMSPFVHVAAELLSGDSEVIQQAARADEEMKKMATVSHSVVTSSLTTFSCDHVVSANNVLLQCIARGPTAVALDFRHQSRATEKVCDELGHTLLQAASSIPCGLVVFLPSYSYEAHLTRRWRQTGLWSQLEAVKRLHREPKSAKQVDAALTAYSRDAAKGALLLSVVGGKMSEGINFSNDMARGVVVVGLPYPDITDPILREKMASLDEAGNAVGGQAYLQNLCMRQVNQSVGRAIRHVNDYAAILLLDVRYQTVGRIWSSLPQWLKRGAEDARHVNDFETHKAQLEQFFAAH